MNYLNGNEDFYYALENGSTSFIFRNENSEDKWCSNNSYGISFLFINGIVAMPFSQYYDVFDIFLLIFY